VLKRLTFFEQGVDKSHSNICEEYCERFQLIFLHPLTSPEYCFLGHFTQHCAHDRRSRHLLNLWSLVARVVVDHHQNVYAALKPAFSSLPHYHTLLQQFVMSLKEICVAEKTKRPESASELY
jgi:hypothetical protein